MKKILLSVCILAITGCAGNISQIGSDGEPVDVAKVKSLAEQNRIAGYTCEKIKQTGSHLSRLVCSTAAEIKDKEEVSRGMREAMRTSHTECSGACKGS